MKKLIKITAYWFITYFYSIPKAILSFVIKGKKYCNHKSYFPELPQKSKSRIWVDQLIQCIKFGYPNEFYFPYGFDVKSDKEISKYLHYAPFMRLRDSQNLLPHSATSLLRNKLYFGFFTEGLGISSGNNVGMIDGDIVFKCSEKGFEGIELFLSNLQGRYIFKPVEGECGSDIFVLDRAKGRFYDGEKEIELSSLKRRLANYQYIVQEIVTQHPSMASLHPQSLNTIRLVTVRNVHTGEVVVFPSILRIGTGNSFVDNTSQGGIAVAVDLGTGQLGEFGYYKPEFGTRVRKHPDSGIVFSEFTVPYFREAKEQAIKLHRMLPSIQSIGWDIAIGENGPVFIEGNDNWEINGPQICNGPLKKRFLDLLK